MLTANWITQAIKADFRLRTLRQVYEAMSPRPTMADLELDARISNCLCAEFSEWGSCKLLTWAELGKIPLTRLLEMSPAQLVRMPNFGLLSLYHLEADLSSVLGVKFKLEQGDKMPIAQIPVGW